MESGWNAISFVVENDNGNYSLKYGRRCEVRDVLYRGSIQGLNVEIVQCGP
jgi:hypothetical protein